MRENESHPTNPKLLFEMKDLLENIPPASAGTEKPPMATVLADAPDSGSSDGADAAGVLLPIVIEVRGEIVSSNFAAFAALVRTRLSEINRSLATDDDFDQADKDSRAIKSAEADLKSAKERALSQSEDLQRLWDGIDGLSGELAKARLELEAQIKRRKEEVKVDVINAALARFDEIDAPGAKAIFRRSVEESVKGKRTVDSMKKAANQVMVIHLATIRNNRQAIETFEEGHGTTMTLDRHELELKSNDSVNAELRRRFDLKKAADENKRLAAEAETAKIEAKAAVKQAEEAGKPPLPPTRTAASGTQGDPGDNPFLAGGATGSRQPTEHSEWDAFEKAFLAAFAPLKAARAALTFPRNISRAQLLANSLNSTWNNR